MGDGLPLTGWSTIGGDLRIPHFAGLHGLQVMLAVALVLRILAARVIRLHDERTRVALVIVAAALPPVTLQRPHVLGDERRLHRPPGFPDGPVGCGPSPGTNR
ncbi:hypothetical protein ACTWPT_46440 [Nonomuraea sp. 3N208]|uniref:hypothetical protein n=1 Tax=Nonomuraea sp. 3N208 TaxID=3457421 RepID=UPI003FCF8F1E